MRVPGLVRRVLWWKVLVLVLFEDQNGNGENRLTFRLSIFKKPWVLCYFSLLLVPFFRMTTISFDFQNYWFCSQLDFVGKYSCCLKKYEAKIEMGWNQFFIVWDFLFLLFAIVFLGGRLLMFYYCWLIVFLFFVFALEIVILICCLHL